MESSDEQAPDFARAAAGRQSPLLSEFFQFLRHNKRWWLTPIIIILLLVAVLLVVGANAPFIYPLF